MTTLFVDRLSVLDISLLHPDLGLLGDSMLVDARLEGDLDRQGMLLDFGEVKRLIKRCIDEHFDHRLLLPTQYPGCTIIEQGSRAEIVFEVRDGSRIIHRSPREAIALIDTPSIDTNSLAGAIAQRIRPLLPDNVKRLALDLRHEEIDGAWYRYSHGLKQHDGNCQRIAHGHRSAIRIFDRGHRMRDLETDWAARWNNSYIGTGADLQEVVQRGEGEYYRFAYRAGQGEFELVLPKARCYLIDGDTTVENLASHIARCLRAEQPKRALEVQAFEGVGKGAITEL